jgi:hypothetical protein
MKPPTIALSGARKGLQEGDGGGDLTNIQCKAIQNCHNDSPPYNEYILIKMGKKITEHYQGNQNKLDIL